MSSLVSNSESSFLTKLRRVFWPIESHELRKFLPMAAMMFFILMTYSMLRSIKDGFIVTNVGAEALSFLKTYAVTPAAIIFLLVYTWLCGKFKTQTVFYIVTSVFVVYFTVFTFGLYPNQELFHPNHEMIELWANNYPHFKWFIRLSEFWDFATFYVMSELWGSIMLSLLFWQFANQTTRTEEAKRFYSTYGVLGNLGLIATGMLIQYFLSQDVAGQAESPFVPMLNVTIISGLAIMGLYYWINKDIVRHPDLYTVGKSGPKKSKPKLSMGESLKVVLSSKYLGLIAILVITYGISTNLIESVWKDKIKQVYSTQESYTLFMGNYQFWQGTGAIFFMIVGSNIIRRVSWRTAAMITPFMLLATGIVFFSCIFFNVEGLTEISPVMIAIYAGFVQGVLSKATKYSLFDSTKEMAYIPLDDELKSKGKAAVDVVAGRAGKSGGGLITSLTFALFHSVTYAEVTPYFAGVFFVMVIAWLYAVGALNKQYQEQLKEHSY